MDDKTVKADLMVVQLDRARTALAEAKTIGETKKVLDMAHAAEIYARRQQLGEEAIAYAHSIKYEALHKLGGIIEITPKATGGEPYKAKSTGGLNPPVEIPSLLSMGINKDLAKLARRLSGLPAEVFEQVRDRTKSLTAALSALRKQSIKADLVERELPRGRYRVIYADPPWWYGTPQHGKTEQVATLGTHYPSMKTGAICDLPVGDMAADNAVLFLWATSPLLFEAKAVIDAWGFTYKASIVWDKVLHNVGHYVSVRHEFLLICTRGSCLPDSDKLHDSVVSIERTAHSAKPEQFRDIIDEMYTPVKGDRLELFARAATPKHWASWGNQDA